MPQWKTAHAAGAVVRQCIPSLKPSTTTPPMTTRQNCRGIGVLTVKEALRILKVERKNTIRDYNKIAMRALIIICNTVIVFEPLPVIEPPFLGRLKYRAPPYN
jgi:hypothetical protein